MDKIEKQCYCPIIDEKDIKDGKHLICGGIVKEDKKNIKKRKNGN